MTWLVATALAALTDDGFVVVRSSSGCTIAARPDAHPAGPAMRAECHWPEVQPELLAAELVAYDRYPRFIFPLEESRIERVEVGRSLVYQRQKVAGLSPREVLLWMTSAREGAGTARVAWTAATEVPLALQANAVRTPRNDGRWEVWPDPAGGARMFHEISVDGGGGVPRWIVQFARNWAYTRILSDTREYAAGLSR